MDNQNYAFKEKPGRRLYEGAFEFTIPLEFNACVDRLEEFAARSSILLDAKYDEIMDQMTFTLYVFDSRYKPPKQMMRLKGTMHRMDDNATHFSITMLSSRWDDDTFIKFIMISFASGCGLLLIFSAYPALCNWLFVLTMFLLYSVIILLHTWRNETRKVRQLINQIQRYLLFTPDTPDTK